MSFRKNTSATKLINSEKFKFILSGLSINGSSFIAYLILVWLDFSPKTSLTLLYWVGVLLSFTVNRRFVFMYSGAIYTSFIKYTCVYLLGYVISMFVMTIALDRLMYSHIESMIIASIIMPIYFYFMQKYLVFK